MAILTTLYNLTRSSESPEKLSLMIAGLITAVAAYAVSAIPVICQLGIVCLDAGVVSDILKTLSLVITGILGVIGSVMTLVGLIRKVMLKRWSAAV